MTIYFVKNRRYHTFPEASRCASRYLGEPLRASLRDDYGRCCSCFPDDCQDDD
jgi:hypothetical protein